MSVSASCIVCLSVIVEASLCYPRKRNSGLGDESTTLSRNNNNNTDQVSFTILQVSSLHDIHSDDHNYYDFLDGIFCASAFNCERPYRRAIVIGSSTTVIIIIIQSIKVSG